MLAVKSAPLQKTREANEMNASQETVCEVGSAAEAKRTKATKGSDWLHDDRKRGGHLYQKLYNRIGKHAEHGEQLAFHQSNSSEQVQRRWVAEALTIKSGT